jgi:hypothetical protein
VVYSSQIDGQTHTFGVSGRLYKSNVLLYDHQTESLWSQLKHTAIAGPLAGTELQRIPVKRTTWGHWRENHPQTRVLSTDTGYDRDYEVDPYEGYYRALGVMFPVGDVRTDLPAKEMVMGIDIAGAAKAYPLSLLKDKGAGFSDQVGQNRIRISLSPDAQVVDVHDAQGRSIPVIFAYWFAWQAFHPGTDVYGGGN